MPEKALIEDAVCIRASGKAILVDVDGFEAWIPVSQIDDDSEVFEEGTEGLLIIPQWLAVKKGFVDGES